MPFAEENVGSSSWIAEVHPAGKYFTFVHFIMAIQKLAEMKHKEGSMRWVSITSSLRMPI